MVGNKMYQRVATIVGNSRIVKLKPTLPIAVLSVLFAAGAVALAIPNSEPTLNQDNQESSEQTGNSQTQPANGELLPLNTTEDSKSETKVESKTNITTNGQSSVNLEVNGQSVPIPENGSHTQTITNNGNQTKVEVHVEGNSESSSDSNEDTNIRIRSDTDSDVNIRSSTRSP
ncbi:hypothetical protein H0X10_01860 [Candidatus Saccharibacteria bacterium]|nr:hypothetical protein [Candidatus Saccharibacteria bacterium]